MKRLPTLILLQLLAWAAFACCADDWLVSGSLGLSINDFHYEEEAQSGSILDTEDGYLHGLSIDLSSIAGVWRITGSLRYRRGEVEYRAYPSSSQTLESRTRETLKQAALDLVYRQHFSDSIQLDYLIGMGLRHWQRDIQSLPEAAGLQETYTWPYVSLGLQPTYRLDARSRLALLLRFNQAYDTRLEVEFKQSQYATTTLDLDAGRGLEIELTWLRSLTPSLTLGLAPYLELWQFDQSDPTPLTRNGAAAGKIYEPASLTRSAGIRLFITCLF